MIIAISDGKVMMEYIGATGAPVEFDDVPVDVNIDFHFILGFAIDADFSGTPQNGVFSPYWAATLTPDAVAATKSRHPNVKALASLSGWSLAGKTLSWYNPSDPNLWISNAYSSLKSLILTYHLDGIDVDYERFPQYSNDSFAYCIGELITLLKNQSLISMATVAPFYNTVSPYIELYERTEQFDTEKVLPSYEVNGRGIQGDAFFEALRLLEDNGFDVNGAMIFSADASASNGYYYEIKTQEFLLSNATS
ncbi:Chitinase 1 [Sesamum alatum]|uniref:Chitinase 1 n=1 Tax=Sesamum alatum TaxID=300844 RepID=A0AAE1XRN0_9LAMI|nr:Chitinase 1 [Sesamum alatum]